MAEEKLPDMDNPIVQEYYDRGYFIVDDAVEPEMLEDLEAASLRCVEKVRSGEVVDGNDAMGVNGPGSDAFHINGLMAPEFGEGVFSEYLLTEGVLKYVRPFFGDQLRLGWVACWATDREYSVGWHRDVGSEERDGSYDVEMEILRRYRKYQIKWHLPMIDDSCLWYVPGSQRRYRTDAEREVLINNPDGGEIEGALQVTVKRGQTLFYHGNGIHRARKPAGMRERLTLTGSLVRHREGDREVLDERYRWRLAEGVRESLPAKMWEFYDNWTAAVTP